MCKLVIIVNKSGENDQTLKKLIQINVEELAKEKDGYSTYRDGKCEYFQGTGPYVASQMEKNIAYRGEKIMMIHSRTRTCGAADKTGLHLQKLFRRYVFAHNGTCGMFSNAKNFSDSYYFFRNLILTNKSVVTHAAVALAVKESKFWGKGVLYDEKEEELHFFCGFGGDFHILPKCIVISSYTLEDEVKSKVRRTELGFHFNEEKTKKIEFLETETLRDTYVRFKNGEIVEWEKIETGPMYGSRPNGGYNGRYENYSDEDYDDMYMRHSSEIEHQFGPNVSKKKRSKKMKKLLKKLKNEGKPIPKFLLPEKSETLSQSVN